MRRLVFTFCLAVIFGVAAKEAYASNRDEAGSSRLPDPAVYAELGASADGKAYVIVLLREPAEVADVTHQKRREAVKQVQDGVLGRLGPGDFNIVYKYENFAAMTGRINSAGLAKLAADADVEAIGPDGVGHGHLAQSVPFINADDVHVLGYTGQGITVAVLDTGIDSDHPDINDNVASGAYHFLNGGVTQGPGAEDDHGHGTNVSGIITSKGVVAPVGVAPDADILAIKVLKKTASGGTTGKLSDWTRGVDYVVSHQADYRNLCIINMSLGSSILYSACPCDNGSIDVQALQRAIQAAKHSGIVTFASSGNKGYCDRMSAPACVSAATAVAAVYDQDRGREPDSNTYGFYYGSNFAYCYDATTAPDKITCFSNRSGCNELAAPGRRITGPNWPDGTVTYTGTSQASPHCAGVAALMREKAASLGISLSPNQIVQTMKDTGVATIDDCGTSPNPIRVDALAAVNEVGSEPKPVAEHLKWSQPPIEIGPNPEAENYTYCGWNQQSWAHDPCGAFLGGTVADDFRCLGTMPVTSIHWWGSHIGWDRTFPPPQQPSGWWFRFWSNVAANPTADPCNSHPGTLLSEFQVPADRVPVEWVGYDVFSMLPPEACFQYYVDLEPQEYFWQADYNDSTVDSVFWLAISAVYPDDINVVYPWGWKTRPWHWMDDAVIYECRVVGWEPCGAEPFPLCPIIQCAFWPIKDPMFAESYDLAFELGTDANYVKWEQPFTGLQDWPHYEDQLSMGGGGGEPNNIALLAADDWRCEQRTAVTAAAWWGSYMGYAYHACWDAITRPVKPDYFYLTIWDDVPDPNPGDPTTFSHPNDIIWQYRAYDYDEVLVGYDKHPEGSPDEPVFRYSVKLPEESWFVQRNVNNIYWFSVVAVYNRSIPSYNWGWTNHEHVFNDDAVKGLFDPLGGWSWRELLDQTGAPADMSFLLFTDPNECTSCADYYTEPIVNFDDYTEFADGWQWTGPAGGYNNSDLNCDGIVEFTDLKIFAEQWLGSCP
jgi:subtilisin family serine protease